MRSYGIVPNEYHIIYNLRGTTSACFNDLVLSTRLFRGKDTPCPSLMIVATQGQVRIELQEVFGL